MELDMSLVKEFADITNDSDNTKRESTVYGTIVEYGGKMYAKIDGSDVVTPVSTTANMKIGDRVIVTLKNHTATVTGNMSDPSASSARVTELGTEVTRLDTVIADKANITDLNAQSARIDTLAADNVTINAKLTAYNADIEKLEADNATINGKLTANSAHIDTLQADYVSVNQKLAANEADIGNLKTDNVTVKEKLTAAEGNIDKLEADNVTINSKLTANEADISDLKTDKLDAETAKVTYATIDNLNAQNGKIDNLEADVADIDTLIFGSASGDVIQTSFANAVIAQLGNAQIKSAMIDSVSADKITAGDVITNKVRVMSEDGSLVISDETMQISDESRVRVQIGKDASGDYSINIWDVDGNLMFSKGGITDSAIKDAIIRNDMVSDDANISASKLDIDSLFTEINDSSKTIKSSKIFLDDKSQTLDVAFTSLTTDVEGIEADVSSQGTQLSVVQGQISSKIWQQDIDNIEVGGRNLLKNSSFSSDFNGWNRTNSSYTSITKEDGYDCGKITGAFDTVVMMSQDVYNATTKKLEPNQTYTLSVWAKTKDIVVGTNPYFALYTDGYYVDDGGVSKWFQYGSFSIPNNISEWTHITASFTTDDRIKTTSRYMIYVYARNFTGELFFRNLKLEKGNRATDWTPAPEDTDAVTSDLSTKYSSLTQTLSGFQSTVAETYATKVETNDNYDKIASRGEQLITNGSGGLGDNTNFKKLTYDGSVANNSAGSFTHTRGAYGDNMNTDEYISVNSEKTYEFSFDMKSLNKTGLMYSYLAMYDIDKNLIGGIYHSYVSGTTTTLAQDLKPGDTVIHVTDLSKWDENKSYGTRVLIWAYTNSFGYTYPKETYTRHVLSTIKTGSYPTGAFDYTNNTITLSTAYTGTIRPAGTYISQGVDNSNYKYYPLSYSLVPTDWTTYKVLISGTDYSGTNDKTKFSPGTAYVKVGFLWNYNKADDQIWATNISLRDVTDIEDAKTEIDDVKTRVSSAESSIMQNTNSIALRVTRTELETEIDNIEVGGRNLLKNSRHVPIYSNNPSVYPIASEVIIENGREFTRYRRTNVTSAPTAFSTYSRVPLTQVSEKLTGNEITFSFLIRCSHNIDMPISCGLSVDGVTHSFTSNSPRTNVGPYWKRIHITGIVDEDYEMVSDNRFWICPGYISNIPSGEIENFYIDMCEWKVEKGNKATDWSPAPEDVQSEISSAQSSILQLSDRITSNVSETEGLKTRMSTVEQTADDLTVRLENVTSMGEELVVNGDGAFGNNTNFKSWIYDGSTANNSAGSFTITSRNALALRTNEFISVNSDREYMLSLDAKSLNSTGTMQTFVAMYDIDKLSIQSHHHMYLSGSLTTFAQDLKPGDTVAYLADISKWDATRRYFEYLSVWNYTNSFGYTYPKETYTRNNIRISNDGNGNVSTGAFDVSNNSITLQSAYAGETIPAGTYVSQGGAGSTYKYTALQSAIILPTEWTTYKGVVKGVDYSGTNKFDMFSPGTAYAKIGFLWNFNSADDQQWVTNVSLRDTTDVAEASKTATNYLNFSDNALVVGNLTADTLGNNVAIDTDSVDIRNGETVLASYGADLIELAKNSENAKISLCGGKGLIEFEPEDDFRVNENVLEVSSDELRLRGKQRTSLYSTHSELDYESESGSDEGASVYATSSSVGMYATRSTNLTLDRYGEWVGHYESSEFEVTPTSIYGLANGIDMGSRYESNYSTVSGDINIDAGGGSYNVNLNGMPFGVNKVLWDGAYYMQADQSVVFSEALSSQPHGIVLMWVAYSDGSAQPYDFVYRFVPKEHLTHNTATASRGVSMGLLSSSDMSYIGNKYVYISDTGMAGNANNILIGTKNGITYNNKYWVLRKVIGV